MKSACVLFTHTCKHISARDKHLSCTTMLSRASTTLIRRALPLASRHAFGNSLAKTSLAATSTRFSPRSFTTLEESVTADDAWKKSCYVEIDYTIPDEATVYDAVQRFAAYNIGCLITVDGTGRFLLFARRSDGTARF